MGLKYLNSAPYDPSQRLKLLDSLTILNYLVEICAEMEVDQQKKDGKGGMSDKNGSGKALPCLLLHPASSPVPHLLKWSLGNGMLDFELKQVRRATAEMTTAGIPSLPSEMILMQIQHLSCKLLGALFSGISDAQTLHKMLLLVPDFHIVMVVGLHIQLSSYLEFKELL